MCNNDKFIDETDDWIKFLMDRLGNAKIVSGSDSKSVQVWDAVPVPQLWKPGESKEAPKFQMRYHPFAGRP